VALVGLDEVLVEDFAGGEVGDCRGCFVDQDQRWGGGVFSEGLLSVWLTP
jgi:hypothetical protein